MPGEAGKDESRSRPQLGLRGWEPCLLRGLFMLSHQLLIEQRGGFASMGAGAESRALTKPVAIDVPEERGLEAGGSGGPGGPFLPLGFCLNGMLNANRFKVWFKQLICSTGKG